MRWFISWYVTSPCNTSFLVYNAAKVLRQNKCRTFRVTHFNFFFGWIILWWCLADYERSIIVVMSTCLVFGCVFSLSLLRSGYSVSIFFPFIFSFLCFHAFEAKIGREIQTSLNEIKIIICQIVILCIHFCRARNNMPYRGWSLLWSIGYMEQWSSCLTALFT